MSLGQGIKSLARNTFYSAITLATLFAPGCGVETHNFGDIPRPPVERRVNSRNSLESGLEEIPNSQISYNPRLKAYEVNGKFNIRGLRVGEQSDEKPEDQTYLFFDGREHDDKGVAYLSLGEKKLVIGAPARYLSPSVEFLPGNPYLDVAEDNFVMLQASGEKRGGHIKVEKKDHERKIPRATSTSGYTIFSGTNGVRYNDELEARGAEPIHNENIYINEPRKPIPLHVVTTNRIGQRVHDWDVVFDRHGRVALGEGSTLESYPGSLRNGAYTSIRQAYHDLSLERQEREKAEAIAKELKRQGITADFEIRTTVPNFSPQPPEGMQGGDGYEPSMPRQAKPNKLITPSGKYIIIN